MFQDVIDFLREAQQATDFLPLHEPKFIGNEKKYVADCIDSTFVSSVGRYVGQFEKMVAEYSGAKYGVATCNGTSALHVALKLVGVDGGSEVITQPLTFVATGNAISYCNAKPIFVDVDKQTLGLSPYKLKAFLDEFAYINDQGECINKSSNRAIKACVPMHTFGHPCEVDKIVEICDNYRIPVVEDAAESLGSVYKGKHTGSFGRAGIFSFNGNKIVTSGAGGVLVTDDESLATQAKHITTTAKVPHRYEYNHDQTGYNYRLTNISAALGVAQMEQLDFFVQKQRELAEQYAAFFSNRNIAFVAEPVNAVSNYWLNALILDNRKMRDDFLRITNDQGVMTRPVWELLSDLKMFEGAQSGDLSNAKWLADRIVNIPSTVVL